MNDGGPAAKPERHIPFQGDLRDWFASMALQGHLANPGTTNHAAYSREGLADECYFLADAMLQARQQT